MPSMCSSIRSESSACASESLSRPASEIVGRELRTPVVGGAAAAISVGHQPGGAAGPLPEPFVQLPLRISRLLALGWLSPARLRGSAGLRLGGNDLELVDDDGHGAPPTFSGVGRSCRPDGPASGSA